MEAWVRGEHGPLLNAVLVHLAPRELAALGATSRALLAASRQEWLWR